ncbi:hypothetical protein GGI21_002269 [Coemansia aciculifera]|uniref:Uncharacterized protein n=1 Tax=Coemansia aciculifera TaxID=417176 RepID=A0ACC1M9S6_9FUNG|nr:hypothetical protein IWW38_000429 [Coemansia aciculifera]KAJ2909052.1 hypothetical protein GGI21_002269 [Coemansia aciculifera]
MAVYRGLLKQARAFFDDNTSDFIQSYTKAKFRIGIHQADPDRAHKHLRSARTTMHLLERANKHRFVDVISVLEFGYGRKGPRRVQMVNATAGLGKREEIFGSLEQVSKYRPAFYAMAKHSLGESKLRVNPQILRSKQPLNVAKMQDKHWSDIRHKIKPPVDKATMAVLEERAHTGIVNTSRLLASQEDKDALERWTGVWVKMPPKRQVRRYYRTLLEQVSMMQVTTIDVPNTGKYLKSMARHSTVDALGREKPDLVPKKTYTFTKSALAGKRGLGVVNAIDIAGLAL